MWWLGAPGEAPATVAPLPARTDRPENYVTPKVGTDTDVAFGDLAELSDRISPLAACRVMFVHAPYREVGTPITPNALRDDLYDPCAGVHTSTGWTSPKGRDYSICRRCGCFLDVA